MTYDAFETSQRSGAPVECYKFVSGGSVYLYTSADAYIDVGGESYAPTAISRGVVDQSQEDAAGETVITLPRSLPLAVEFMAYTPPAPVQVTIFRRHRADAEAITVFSGEVGSARFQGSDARLSCLPTPALLSRVLPRLYFQVECNWPLYSAGCGLNKEDYRDDGTVSGIAGATVTAAVFGTRAAGYYVNGWAENANGDRRFIIAHSGSTITLLAPFFGLAVSDAISAFAGCNRLESDCVTKFGNLANHSGAPRAPLKNPWQKGIN